MRADWPAKTTLPETVATALQCGVHRLTGRSPSPAADARLLLSRVCERSREWLAAHDDAQIDASRAREFFLQCDRRAAGEPVAYITGRAGFYGREFAVDERVLIPRPETELMTEEAIAHLRGIRAPAALDAGTGSGAVACTIAAEVRDAVVDAVDVSPGAIAVAQENAERLGVRDRCRFAVADVAAAAGASFDAVVANLPYIPSRDVPGKPDPAGFEPRAALDGGPDGLDAYRKLLSAAPRLLRTSGILLMEAAPPTIGELARLTQAAFPGAQIIVRKDYAGLERWVSARR